jgi:hypothetical protein
LVRLVVSFASNLAPALRAKLQRADLPGHDAMSIDWFNIFASRFGAFLPIVLVLAVFFL